MRELSDLLLAYAPQPSFDDMGWYALAYTRVYEMDKTAKDYFRVAKNIYNWIWKQGWDVSGKYCFLTENQLIHCNRSDHLILLLLDKRNIAMK